MKEAFDSDRLNLAGVWTCRLDPDGVGAELKWAEVELDHPIHLPGSLDEAGLGEPAACDPILGGLSRRVSYVGQAWMTRSCQLPQASAGERLLLRIERSHWFIQPWVEGTPLAEQDGLSVQQEWDVTPWQGREVRLTLKIDNTSRIPIGRICHAITDWTQTNWNGVIGSLEVVKSPPGALTAAVRQTGPGLVLEGAAQPGAEVRFSIPGHSALETQADPDGSFQIPLDDQPLPAWSDLSPILTEAKVESNGQSLTLLIGHRTFTAEGKKLLLNGQPVFLLGTLECCVFPLTGYPPMESGPWKKIMAKAKEFGLNHIRFHSWCPPEAAFVAADELGVILQVELPLWTGKWPMSSDPHLMGFCRREAFRILEAYSHHPSFCLFTLGNEMAFYGEEPEVDQLLRDLKAAFPHILFNFSSHGTHLSPECSFYVQADNGRPGSENLPLRGSTWFGVGSRFDRESPSTTTVCDAAAAQFDRPVISHEVGEWAVFPRLSEAEKYSGVLEPRNFGAIGQMLAERGMLDQAEAFTQASGQLSAQLYKEEIETLLRTKGLAGVQLLGLNDFPGQGTATIGMLDAFWEEKGFITGQEFTQFCSDSVPLMKAEKFVWTQEESLSVSVSAFVRQPMGQSELTWRLKDSKGDAVAQGVLAFESSKACEAEEAGQIQAPLQTVNKAEKLTLEADLKGGGTNQWSFWVFPSTQPQFDLSGVKVFAWYREDVRQALRQGETVWLMIHPDRIWTGIPGRFAPAFWSPVHFKEQVGTMGALIQKDNPLLAGFPTESFTEWQWWEILTRSKAAVLNHLPLEHRPVLQIIDRYDRNWKLGTIFEARVGPGRLLASLIDFETPDRPAAHQLEACLSSALAEGRFDPQQEITLAQLDRVFAQEP